MTIIENYLTMLNERRTSVSDSTILYHGSKVQNLKVIDPERWKDALLEEHVATIWTSWDKGFAAMFCIDWRKNIQDIFLGSDIGYYMSLDFADSRYCWPDEFIDNPKNRKREAESWKDPRWDDPRLKDIDRTSDLKVDAPHCKKVRRNPSWLVVVPTRYKKLLMKPCSLYLVKGKNWNVPQKRHQVYDWEWPEAYSKEPAQVIKELKYSSVVEAYKKNGVKLLIEDMNKERKKWWDKIFSKLKA